MLRLAEVAAHSQERYLQGPLDPPVQSPLERSQRSELVNYIRLFHWGLQDALLYRRWGRVLVETCAG